MLEIINNHAYNEIEAKDPIAQAVSLVVSEDNTVLTVEFWHSGEPETHLTKRNSEGELLWKKIINGTLTGNAARFNEHPATYDALKRVEPIIQHEHTN